MCTLLHTLVVSLCLSLLYFVAVHLVGSTCNAAGEVQSFPSPLSLIPAALPLELAMLLPKQFLVPLLSAAERPRLWLGAPLPTGHESVSVYLGTDGWPQTWS